MRTLLSLAVLAAVGVLFSSIIDGIDTARLWAELSRTSPSTVLIAVLLTAVSFTAISAYDVTAQKVTGGGMPPWHAMRVGFVASAVGQTTGAGLVVCSFLRWRMSRAFGVGPVEGAQVTALVSVGFMASAVVILAALMLAGGAGFASLTGMSGPVMAGAACAILALSIGALAVFWWQPGRLDLPPLRVALRVLALTLLDVLPAAAALWVLFPAEAGITLTALLPVFLSALLLGLLTGTPGGVGVLEVSCLLAFPAVGDESMIATLILFRAVYYVLPFVLAAGIWGAEEAQGRRTGAERRRRSRMRDVVEPAPIGQIPDEMLPAFAASPRAEAGLALLGDAAFLAPRDRQSAWMIARGGNVLVALGDPAGQGVDASHFVTRLHEEAEFRGLTPVVYRASEQTAACLRGAGWHVVQHGAEALVDLTTFSTKGSARSGLRRKLRKAEAGGVTLVRHGPGAAPLASLSAMSGDWLARKGASEQRFALGRFDPDYLRNFDITVAYVEGCPVAFVSLWTSGDGGEWSIDLMRGQQDAPDGIMHALVTDAILQAQESRAAWFSLCCVPFAEIAEGSTGIDALAARQWSKHGAARGWHGLYQFKNGFGPVWTKRYSAFPHWSDAPTAARGVRKLIG